MSTSKKLVESILENNLAKANESLSESFVDILRDKLLEAKKIVAAKHGVAELSEALQNASEETLEEAPRIKLIKARIRGGKVERRVRKSAVKGMTLRGGKLVRMSASERRARMMGARKAKIKRRAKLARALQKRKRSMMKRKALGV
jgi:hypothetical protein